MKRLLAALFVIVSLGAKAQTNNTFSQTNTLYIIQTNIAAMSNNLYLSLLTTAGGVVSNQYYVLPSSGAWTNNTSFQAYFSSKYYIGSGTNYCKVTLANAGGVDVYTNIYGNVSLQWVTNVATIMVPPSHSVTLSLQGSGSFAPNLGAMITYYTVKP